MSDSPAEQEMACGKSKVEVFANAPFLTHHEGSALNTPNYTLSLTK